MIKRPCSLLILLLFFACEQQRECLPHEGDLQALNLNGQVEFTAEYLYSSRQGSLVKTERRNERQFDPCGNIVRETSFDAGGEEIYTKFYHYDRARRLSQVEFYRNGTMNYRDIYWYNEEGQLVTEARYDLAGNLEDEKYYELDDEGRPTMIREYSNGRMITEYIYSYRDGGKRVEWIYEHTASGKQWLQSTVITDSAGNILEKQDDHYITAEYENGNIIRQTRYTDPMMEEQTGEYVFAYDYDAAGNWTRRVGVDSEGDTVSVREREIEYVYNLFADTRQ